MPLENFDSFVRPICGCGEFSGILCRLSLRNLMSMFCHLEKKRYVTRRCPHAGAVGPLIINLSDDDDHEEENRIIRRRALPGKRLMPRSSSQIIDVLYVETTCVLLHKASTV